MSYITCRELISFMDDYVAGGLPPAKVVEFERHLKVCPSCVAYLASYRETIRLARAAVAPPAVEDVPPELLTAILATVTRSGDH